MSPRSMGGPFKKLTPAKSRYETYLIPGETLIPGGRGEAFHPGIGYASYLSNPRDSDDAALSSECP